MKKGLMQREKKRNRWLIVVQERKQENKIDALKFQTHANKNFAMWVQFEPLFSFISPNLNYKSDLSRADRSISSDRCRHRGKSCQIRQRRFYKWKLLLQKETLFENLAWQGGGAIETQRVGGILLSNSSTLLLSIHNKPYCRPCTHMF